MRLFLAESIFPPALGFSAIELPVRTELLMRTIELTPVDTMPFWKLALMFERSTTTLILRVAVE